uniref:PUM-HD domain-containing protein n=1 Tax=Zooxanthella nutricula TaxID=1333877 RepID=A0A7S2KW90_9DINO
MRQGSGNPLIEALKSRDRAANVELSDLAAHIAEIAQDQYGSRLIQQKLEVASEEEKALAFKSVLAKMPQLTTDVFGNYVIQKFFEYGSAEQRRILAEQLVGQVLKLSLHMYGCRVVQKALDSVPIEQQVLLIGELKGMVLKCIEDQHGNHVIQKCIERLPTDRIGFIVESFLGQTNRMAKHCYGCRVIQRLIEYCASAQISPLLDETLRFCMELATDQYGNYVVQHVMEHSSRPGDRQMLMQIVRKNILQLSCHKYASNVIEKALGCGTLEERALLIQAIVGEPGDQHPPLLTMMRDRFGNYIVQRVIALAQGPQREALLWKLHEHMPALKKSNTYGKHIISALERAQAAQPVGNVGFRV